MKFDLQLLPLLVRYPTLYVRHIADAEFSTWYCHPRIPSVVTWSPQWVVAVTVRCPHADASTRECFHCTKTDVRFLASMLS